MHYLRKKLIGFRVIELNQNSRSSLIFPLEIEAEDYHRNYTQLICNTSPNVIKFQLNSHSYLFNFWLDKDNCNQYHPPRSTLQPFAYPSSTSRASHFPDCRERHRKMAPLSPIQSHTHTHTTRSPHSSPRLCTLTRLY